MILSSIDSMLVACRTYPNADLPRLVVAEWLEDNAGTVECGECEGGRLKIQAFVNCICQTCSDIGRISNGFAERAEFIRVQCELARLTCGWCNATGTIPCGSHRNGHACDKCSALIFRSRERELLKDYGGEWVRPLVEAFEMEGHNATDLCRRYATRDGDYEVEQIPYCFVRGLLHVETPLDTLRRCLPRLGRELLWVGSVHCSDREPERNDDSFTWWEDFAKGVLLAMGYILPSPVFARLRNGRFYSDGHGGWRDYDSREAALADLEQNGNLDGWILEEAWTAAKLPWPTRETTLTGG